MRDREPSSSSPPSIRRSGSPSRLVRPSTLKATYSHASLRSISAPSLAQEPVSSSRTSPSSSYNPSSLSSSLTHADGITLPEHLQSESTTDLQGMVLAAGTDISSEAASTTASSSATSTTGSDLIHMSPRPAATGSLVVTGEAEPIDADGVVDTVPSEAKLALRDHLRRRLSDGTDCACACVVISLILFIVDSIYWLRSNHTTRPTLSITTNTRITPCAW